MKNYSKVILLLLFIIVSIVACQKDFDNEISNEEATTEQKADVKVIDGILHFKDVDAFFKSTKELLEMNLDEQNIWEKQIGFISLRTKLNNIFSELENAKSQDEYNTIVVNNKDVLYQNEEEVDERVPILLYQLVSNEKGLYMIEGVAYKVFNSSVFASLDGNFTKLEQINQKSDVNDVLEYEYIGANINKSVEDLCNSYYGTYSSSDRRIKAYIEPFRFVHYHPLYPQTVQRVGVQRRSKSYRYKWWKWRLHRAHHHRKNITYTVQALPMMLTDGHEMSYSPENPYPVDYLTYLISNFMVYG